MENPFFFVISHQKSNHLPEFMSQGKIIVISAPSGCGKSTIINALVGQCGLDLAFSVSATNRPPREGEKHGVHYYFLSSDEFSSLVADDKFIEFEQVYPGRFYGTLRSEVDRLIDEGRDVILDIDVMGALNVKRAYGVRALTIFIEPPSIDELRRRLENRATDSPETIAVRLERAQFELGMAPQFDVVIVNDQLNQAIDRAEQVISKFLENK